jgi:hypothetical protein
VQPPRDPRSAEDRAWAQQFGNKSTVSGSSGQVQRQAPRPRSRRGLWIGLGAAALVGGGVAVAVTAGGDGEGGGGGVGSSSGGGSGSAGSGSAGSTAAGSVASAAPPVAPKPDEPGDPSDGEAGEQQALDEAMKGLDGIDPRMLPPEARKQLEEMRKLSPKARLEKLKQITKGMPKGATGGLAEAMETIDAINAGAGTGTSTSKQARPAGAWVSDRDLAYAGFDPKRVDVSALIRWAIAEARKADPDAALFRIDVSGVGPDGFANLELPTLASDHGSLDLRFFSPARAKPDPSLPIGVPEPNKTCEFRIEAEPDGVRLRPIRGGGCKGDIPIPPPRCTAAALWKRALAAKAPQNAVASLGYRAWSGRFRWGFDIGFGGDKAFSHVFEDDCVNKHE